MLVCDRFTDATFAYQGGGRGFDLTVLSNLEQYVQGVPELGANFIRNPDLTLWFDLPPAVAAERLACARVPDRFESQPSAFFARVANGYALRAAQAPARFARIDASVERDAVWQQIHAVLVQRGWLGSV